MFIYVIFRPSNSRFAWVLGYAEWRIIGIQYRCACNLHKSKVQVAWQLTRYARVEFSLYGKSSPWFSQWQFEGELRTTQTRLDPVTGCSIYFLKLPTGPMFNHTGSFSQQSHEISWSYYQYTSLMQPRVGYFRCFRLYTLPASHFANTPPPSSSTSCFLI